MVVFSNVFLSSSCNVCPSLLIINILEHPQTWSWRLFHHHLSIIHEHHCCGCNRPSEPSQTLHLFLSHVSLRMCLFFSPTPHCNLIPWAFGVYFLLTVDARAFFHSKIHLVASLYFYMALKPFFLWNSSLPNMFLIYFLVLGSPARVYSFTSFLSAIMSSR